MTACLRAALAFLLLVASAVPVTADDAIKLPPASEQVRSPGGTFALAISMQGDAGTWHETGAVAVLKRAADGAGEPLWSRKLPHSLRPRFALVDDAGNTVLFDQWINVAGPHAVMVINVAGDVIADHGFHDVAAALGVAGRDIIPLARHGAWMSAPPRFRGNDGVITVASGGRVLVVHPDGSLGVMAAPCADDGD